MLADIKNKYNDHVSESWQKILNQDSNSDMLDLNSETIYGNISGGVLKFLDEQLCAIDTVEI